MEILEMQSAFDIEKPSVFPRHPLEGPELCHREMFYPLGFPVEVNSNAPQVLLLARGLWAKFEKRFDQTPIRLNLQVVEGDSAECPPAPVTRIAQPLLIHAADSNNYCVVNLERNTAYVSISRGTLEFPAYLQYFFLTSAALCHVSATYTTPVHAGCVALDGRGVLLCGDSGAGKSSLAYACARAGWTYVSDDASYLLHGEDGRLVTGDCYRVRFRPSAAELFPEVSGLEVTPRAEGKPSIELATASLPNMVCAQTARADFVVFLNRHVPGPAALVPYPKEAALHSMEQVLFSSGESRIAQNAALTRLLKNEIFELRYSDLASAMQRLEGLVRQER